MSSYTFTGQPPPLAVLGHTVMGGARSYASLEHRCPGCGAVYEIRPIILGAKSGYPGFCPYCGEHRDPGELTRRDHG